MEYFNLLPATLFRSASKNLLVCSKCVVHRGQLAVAFSLAVAQHAVAHAVERLVPATARASGEGYGGNAHMRARAGQQAHPSDGGAHWTLRPDHWPPCRMQLPGVPLVQAKDAHASQLSPTQYVVPSGHVQEPPHPPEPLLTMFCGAGYFAGGGLQSHLRPHEHSRS